MNQDQKIIFMGTPKIAADILQSMIDAKANISLVVTQPDRKVGRKQKIEFSPVKEVALRYGIPVFQPARIRNENERLLEEKASLIVTCAFGQILSEENLKAVGGNAVNLHASLLPEYRGCAPIQRAIWDGKKITGMSLMKMEKGMDTGGVLDAEEIVIDPDETSSTLFEKMAVSGAGLINRNLPVLLEGKAEFVPQDDARQTYAAKITPEEERIDFSRSDREIYSQIRALLSEPGAWFVAGGKKMKILECRYVPYSEGENREPFILKKDGKKKMSLHLRDGKLDLLRVQPEGKAAMDIAAFVNGAGRALDGSRI